MPYAPSDLLAARHRRLRARMREASLDALVVTCLPNIFYLTNFDGSAAIVLLTADRLYFITDFRYVSAVQLSFASDHGCPEATLVSVDGTYDGTLAALFRRLGHVAVGFEAAHLTVSRFRWFEATLAAPGGSRVTLVPVERLVEMLRLQKDAHELATLRAAGGLLSDVAVRVFEEVRPGRTEREVAALIDDRIKRGGFDDVAFDTIVASGPNGALPHARAGNRRLEAGDLIVLDFGGIHDGYCVDITRTISLGDAGPEARRVYAAVASAQRAAIDAVRPGVRASAVDQAARDVLAREGLADRFGHSTGHGLGIEVHEEPRIGKPPANPSGAAGRTGDRAWTDAIDPALAPGMVFTIEPGAYVPDWGGVRIEDDIALGDAGVELLTTVSRELCVLG